MIPWWISTAGCADEGAASSDIVQRDQVMSPACDFHLGETLYNVFALVHLGWEHLKRWHGFVSEQHGSFHTSKTHLLVIRQEFWSLFLSAYCILLNITLGLRNHWEHFIFFCQMYTFFPFSKLSFWPVTQNHHYSPTYGSILLSTFCFLRNICQLPLMKIIKRKPPIWREMTIKMFSRNEFGMFYWIS